MVFDHGMTMILPDILAGDSAQRELLESELEDYLGMLARTKPFSLEIAAEAAQLFDALASNWPQVAGWEKPMAELHRQIRELAEPLLLPGGDSHLRLSLNIAVGPRTAPPEKNVAAVRAAFDVGESAVYYQAIEANQKGDVVFDHITVGLALLIQPFKGQGDARAVGMGIE
jgi:hypothetical protein